MLCCRSAFLRLVCLMPSDLHISCKFLLSIPLLMTSRSTGSTLRGPPPIEAILCDRSSWQGSESARTRSAVYSGSEISRVAGILRSVRRKREAKYCTNRADMWCCCRVRGYRLVRSRSEVVSCIVIVVCWEHDKGRRWQNQAASKVYRSGMRKSRR